MMDRAVPVTTAKMSECQRLLFDAMREALRAWIRADKEGLPTSLQAVKRSEARRLTGVAVTKGLLL
jgi:hypothetical protein